MGSDRRSLELEVEVAGTPEEVWRAIATGPGISSWYVPHTVEEREGGAATASFGPGPEMLVPGRVVTWEPPRRISFDGGEDVEGLAFEWLVEARDNGRCIVRLVNSGFGSGEEWDGQYDAMSEGWLLFLFNLKLHLEHFRGQNAIPMMPTATWEGPREATWLRSQPRSAFLRRQRSATGSRPMPLTRLPWAAPLPTSGTGGSRSWSTSRPPAPQSWPSRERAHRSASPSGHTCMASTLPRASHAINPFGRSGSPIAKSRPG